MKRGKRVNEALLNFVKGQLKDRMELIYGEGENQLIVNVIPTISFEQRTELIKSIIGLVFANDGSSINDYRPYFIEFAKRFAVIANYTDIEIPTKLNDAWAILNTCIYDDVLQSVGQEIADILAEADIEIRTRRDYLVNKTDFNALIEKAVGAFDSLSDLFKGVDPKQIMKTLDGIAKMSSNEFASSVLKARDNNDSTETEK